MLPPNVEHRDHFYKGEHANSSHFKAYCKYDTKYHLELLERDEKAAFDAGTIDVMQTKDVLLPEVATKEAAGVTTGKIS
ncbi:hypothetical protein L208DRAFT_1388032 [Tricholoma matsutake]|nr:hypothetical protein L208DRAFT_1388032 [Tricholoma matsutake 945]